MKRFFYFFCILSSLLFLIGSDAKAQDKSQSKSLSSDNSITNAYQEGEAAAAQHQGETIQQIQTIDPSKTFSHFTDNPQEAHYFGGVKQPSAAKMVQDAVDATPKSESGKSILDSFNERPQYRVDKNTDGMKKSDLIQGDAAHIVDAISDQFIDCKKTEECKTTYTNSSCTEPSRSTGSVTCTKDLSVQTEPHQQLIQVTAQNHDYWFHRSFTVKFDLRSGKVVSGDQGLDVTSNALLTPSITCENFKIDATTIQSLTPSWAPTKVNIKELPNCSNQFQMTFEISGGISWWFFEKMSAVVNLSLESTHVSEQWTDNCMGLESQSACQLLEDHCSIGTKEKVINGFRVTRPCWQKQLTYRCGPDSHIPDTCGPLRDHGCEQIGSTCSAKMGDTCIAYDQTFRCPIQKCSGGIGIICNGQSFCLKGDCSAHHKIPDEAFRQSVAALSAAADASKQVDQVNFRIFTGHDERCSVDGLSFCDCCQDSGWGQDVHLANCSDAEKKLGHNKEVGLTIYVGEYCARHLPWPLDHVCVEHKKTYCTFGSKLARIIQQQGRWGQLHIDFGGPESPNCQGLIPDKFQQIKFDQIDFQEVYQDIEQKMKIEATSKVNSRIAQDVEDFYKGGRSHGK